MYSHVPLSLVSFPKEVSGEPEGNPETILPVFLLVKITGDSPQGIKMAPTRLALLWSIACLCVRQCQSLIILVPGAEDHPLVKLVNIQACLPQPVPLVAGGRMVMPTELPWLAVLSYKDDLRCGGSLINEQFVLTAAHCLVDDDNRPRQLRSVVLGEHNRSSIDDCYEKQGRKICADTPISFLIEDIIVHPEYKPNMNNNVAKADIALIKLNKKAKLSAFIRPICLPVERTEINITEFTTAGWGKTETRIRKVILKGSVPTSAWRESAKPFQKKKHPRTPDQDLSFDIPIIGSLIYCKSSALAHAVTEAGMKLANMISQDELSDVPMEVNVPYVPYKECVKLLHDFNIPRTTICAGGKTNKNSCQGDSGGPLAARAINSHNTYLMGIVSSGVSRWCGKPHPSVYTDVSAHLKWILDNLGGTEVSRTFEGGTGIKDLDMQGDEPVSSGSDQPWYRQLLGSIPLSDTRIADDPYIPKVPHSKSNRDNGGIDRFDINNGASVQNNPRGNNANKKICWDTADGAHHCSYSAANDTTQSRPVSRIYVRVNYSDMFRSRESHVKTSEPYLAPRPNVSYSTDQNNNTLTEHFLRQQSLLEIGERFQKNNAPLPGSSRCKQNTEPI
uniref:Peptidase S1 domain-containing protein n=1 Tax=Timema genevievae TaxID=629358 RepID=A0A7R9JSV6_TIMGE|nr:unnamed protein product [Timema genevievae]